MLTSSNAVTWQQVILKTLARIRQRDGADSIAVR
jgi:hypothetical protein